MDDLKEFALKRFYNLERRIQHDSNLKQRQVDFLSEYKSLGHMTKVSEDSNSDFPLWLSSSIDDWPDTSSIKFFVVYPSKIKKTNCVAFSVQCEVFVLYENSTCHHVLFVFQK